MVFGFWYLVFDFLWLKLNNFLLGIISFNGKNQANQETSCKDQKPNTKDQMNMNCYCCSNKPLTECCEPFLNGIAKPNTAEQLMRSRYSAYAIVNVEYLIKTTHPATRKFHESQSIKEWAESNIWQKLEVISTSQGGAKDKKGTVEFKAYYLDANNEPQIHHEHSNFVKELGKWFFVDGKSR